MPTRQQLVQMVDQVMNASACMVDFDSMLQRLEKQFPGVDIGKMIFDPPSGKRLTAEQVVDQALQKKSNLH